jgi:hypothetical protein
VRDAIPEDPIAGVTFGPVRSRLVRVGRVVVGPGSTSRT